MSNRLLTQDAICRKVSILNNGLTTQEALNRFAGTTGRTKQECLNIIYHTIYGGGVRNLTGQEAINRLSQTVGFTKQESANREWQEG